MQNLPQGDLNKDLSIIMQAAYFDGTRLPVVLVFVEFAAVVFVVFEDPDPDSSAGISGSTRAIHGVCVYQVKLKAMQP